jgi:His/Glu/Gln/Arg/opine family amino acid ABC transporter permease subunit
MFDFSLVRDSVAQLLLAVPLTLGITAGALLLGMAAGIPVALARASETRSLRWAANAYILFFRGTPALVQIFLVYYGAGQFEWIRTSPLWIVLREPLWCVIIALGLNSAAYTGKMLAGAISAVPRGTVEAAQSVGLSRWRTLRLVIFPLAIRTAIPAYGNEVILTLKASSLGCTVTLLELTGTARLIVSKTYAPYEVFAVAGLIYLALTFVFTRVFAWVERRVLADASAVSVASLSGMADAVR